MRYSDFGNNNEYKIVVKKKKYFFRDAIKLFLTEDDLSLNIEESSKKIIDLILGIIKLTSFEVDNDNKIIFTNHIIQLFAQKMYIARSATLTYRIIEYLKKNKIISKKSQSFAKIHKEYDPNKLTSCFIENDLTYYDRVLDLRDEILEKIENPKNIDKRELFLYYYLKLFSIKKYNNEIYKYFNQNNLFNLNGNIILIYAVENENEYSSVKIVYFDQLFNKLLKEIFFNSSTNILDHVNHYYEKKLEFYEKTYELFLKERYQEITGHTIDNYSKKYFANLIKRQVEFEYQKSNTPFHGTLNSENLYPHTNYLELIKLFPDVITNKTYKNIEIDNLKKQKQHFSIDEDEAAEISINDYFKLKIDAYEELKNFKQYNAKNKKEHDSYIKKLDKFILNNKSSFSFPEMLDYVKYIVSKSKYEDISNDKLASSTIYGYLSIIFTSCFNLIINEGNIEVATIELIEYKLEVYDKKSTRSKYLGVINPFLNLYDYSIGAKKGKNIVYARKSLIFKKELDELFVILEKKDSELYGISTIVKDYRFIIYQRFIFCMLMYYSGLRESELWSRSFKDIYIIESTVVIDVNTNQLIKNFKTHSAKRRVEFTIDDDRYFNILKEYLVTLSTKKIKYCFPKISDKNNILKKKIQNISYFTACSSILQDITGRYVSLHSFRHTYVTKSIRKIVQNKTIYEKNKLYNLVNMIGHLGPEVTLRFYTHIDYVLNYRNVKLF